MHSVAETVFGDLVRQYRLAAGLTQEALAEDAGLNVHSIQNLERGGSRPHRETLRRLILALRLSADDQQVLLSTGKPAPSRRGRVSDGSLTPAEPLGPDLPVALTSFIGRAQEIAHVTELLGSARLLTLTGVGGCGKTRLAVEIGRRVADRYADGVRLVELGSVAEAALVPQAVAIALGIREVPTQPLLTTLTVSLRQKRMLLVLDNCEHLLEACTRLANALLQSCPNLQILATSRETFSLTGEVSCRVPSLCVPPLEPRPAPEELRSYSAVQLFVERARAAHPSFDVTSRNGAAIAQICRRLDGVPLALELAAARLRGLSVEELAARLDQRFRLLTTGNRVALPRQQTLRATIDWSYDLLSTSERALFARLSVFAGAWTIEASEAVCAGDGIDGEAVLELLLRLVDKSLVVSEEDDDANQRYRLLETLRQYAREQLRASGQVEAVHSQHAAYFLELARRLELESAGPRQTNWLEGVADEEHNLGAALEWLEVSGDAERALEMAAVLWRFWEVRGYLSEGRARLAALLHLPGASAVTLARARVLEGAGVLAHFQGDLTSARALYKESLSLYRRCGEPRDATWVLIHLGWLWHDYGRYKAARRFLRQGLALAHESSDRTAIARCLSLLGLIAWGELDFAIARSLHEQSLALNREAGNRWGTAWALHLLGKDLLWQVDTSEADLYEAQVALEGSVAIWQGLGERRERAHANVDLALLAIRHCDLAKARRLLDESLSNFTELNARGDSIVMLHAYADLFAAQNELRRVVRVRGAVSALMPRMGMHPSPLRRAVADYQMESARAALSPTVVASEWAAGEALTLHEAVAYVRDEHGAALSGRAL